MVVERVFYLSGLRGQATADFRLCRSRTNIAHSAGVPDFRMSKRGRRRSSRRRKSSTSSKQSLSPYIFKKQSNSICCSDDVVEKGETDSLGKENILLGFEEKEADSSAPPEGKRFKQGCGWTLFPGCERVHSETVRLEEAAVKIVTSVSVSDLGNPSSKVTFLQSHQPSGEDSSHEVTNTFRVLSSGVHVTLEIQERFQLGPQIPESSLVPVSENRADVPTAWSSVPDNESYDGRWQHGVRVTPPSYTFTVRAPTDTDAGVSCSPEECPCCRHDLHEHRPAGLVLLTNTRPKTRDSLGTDQLWDIPPPPPQFADAPYGSLEDLTGELASFRIATHSPVLKQRPTSLSTNRSSFTTDFICCQRRRSWVRNNSIATVEHRFCSLLQQRRQTFPGVSQGPSLTPEELLQPLGESFSSLIMCSLPYLNEGLAGVKKWSSRSPKKLFSDNPDGLEHGGLFLSPFQMRTWDGDSDTFCQQNRRSILTVFMEADSPPDEDNVEAPDQEVKCENHNQRGLAIQVTPPSCSGSEEQMLDNQPFGNVSEEHSSVQTETDGEHQDSFQLPDSGLLPGSCSLESPQTALEVTDVTSSNGTEISRPSEKLREDPSGAEGPNEAPDKPRKQLSIKADPANRERTLHRSSSESKEHLKPLPHKDRDMSEHWAKRRKLFKESKQWSSAGGSSITSDITEESVSEDAHSADFALQEHEDRGFYTETFHSSTWIFWGEDASSEAIRPNLSTRTRPISIRERTVRINKGSGEYPWGFRIQFSKPIVVTEVDTNGAAEEAGLMVGDYVLAVNGVDVTSIPHSEAANLARQGPDVLTLTIGSDIARGPNTPRPPCRGYLHKRTQSGLIKGWRKRWFVLTHDCCLHYYKHKRDEGKRQPLSSVKLEGAEVGPDDSLGKPFVFKCRPQSGTRVYLLCATSNQEMKRWLEAMEKAILPITQDHVWVDVTRHNSNLPPLAVKSPDCLGLLHKMDRSKDMWVQHYCILKDACLYLYSGIRATHAQGGLYLQGYTVREQPHGSKKSTIELKPPLDEFKTFYLCAENPAENKRWMAAIKASIKKWLPLHHALQSYISRVPEETRM
ncbi:hypothetical protein OJAV_G00115930 [Oryzias javanicus]|uniref:PDZ and pleckstrin homology domains 1 n=1 Tax=Oryzias javanicus TaxID=123683 RepID=A0A3S2MRV8_ORYJA|nr:hypothetical protein OJAV_G00115930 [Oryzias javanicus]